MGKFQVIRYACCNKVFAACTEPECYTEKHWLKDLRKYVLRGDKPEIVEAGGFKLELCTCPKPVVNKSQMSLIL